MPNANEEITADPVRVIDDEGEMLGVISLREALTAARSKGLDLVEVSPTAEPPVCKFMDFGKFKYEAQKRAHDARKKQKITQIKEIKLRPNIEHHDYQVKLRGAQKFLHAGDKVKVTLRFRGREITHKEIAFDLMQRLYQDLEDLAKVEVAAKMDGRQVLMILAPRA